MKIISTITMLLLTNMLLAQSRPVIYRNDKNAYYNKTVAGGHPLFSTKINQIWLNADSTFIFWNQPHESCFTWHEYKGIWRKENDTLFFKEKKELTENGTRVSYKSNTKQCFHISFKTDKNAPLKNRKIKVQYVYDFDTHLEDVEKVFTLRADNTLEIPFKEVPDLKQLAALRIEYLLDFTKKRTDYLTRNNVVNRKEGDVPNVIAVEFVEKLLKEMVYRTTKAIMQNDTLVVVSTSKTKSSLIDYSGDLDFEDYYY